MTATKTTTKAIGAMLAALAFSMHALAAEGPAAPPKKRVSFPKGASETTIKGALKGRGDVDYLVRAAAGQTLEVTMEGSNAQNDFNVLPPGSKDVAMFNSAMTGERSYKGMLPTDGDYAIRVYLGRAAGRRGEASNFTIKVAVKGEALKPLPASRDAKVAGTAYHATAEVSCLPPFATATESCKAGVIRRSPEGSATFEAVAKSGLKRRVLFVKGRPVASDANEPLSSSRDGDKTIVKVGDERYEVPDPLVTGG